MPALATTSIAWVLLAIMVVGWIVYAALNAGAARRELGSELEIAANRKPYLDDEELEGRRLELVMLVSLVMLVIIVIGLPLYWIFEPSRMAGATEGEEQRFIHWGERLFSPTGTFTDSFNCAGCHGGMRASGGVAPFNLTDGRTGEVNAVEWYAPALDTVFYRFDEEEVRFIIVYGRPFSPMSPWGLAGGGPLNDQQVDTLLAYIKSIQIEREDCAEGEDDPRVCDSGHLPAEDQADIDELARRAVDDGEFASYGEALFNLNLASGAYSCARCHTPGWSWGDPGVPGQGAFGWNLTDGAVDTHFPAVD
ncbi:MAG TPA: c-type cytochrome, partial [Ilumatobacteraceae bacterium]|nr:c-type cytochrome [Ilumatobacteraceae bacterium]